VELAVLILLLFAVAVSFVDGCTHSIHNCEWKYYEFAQPALQQDGINLTSHELRILIFQHLMRVVPRPEVLLFTRKKLHHWKWQIFEGGGICLKMPSIGSVLQLFCYFLTTCLLLHRLLQLWRLQKIYKGTLMSLNWQMREISKWNIPFISLAGKV
jgi:hypothetical protein